MKGILLAVSLLMVWGGSAWAQDSGTAQVSWVVAGCWVSLRAHGEIELGVASGETFLEPGYLEDTEDNPLTVITNCWSWTLTASLRWHPPAGHPDPVAGLADFQWWGVEVLSGEVEGWQAEPRAGGGWVATGRGPGEATLLLGYRYNLDPQDVPGVYQVLITYTLTGE
jgi:hypothetical protein